MFIKSNVYYLTRNKFKKKSLINDNRPQYTFVIGRNMTTDIVLKKQRFNKYILIFYKLIP